MARYETPSDIASVLAKFAPSRIVRLLDPAVGGGRLVEPLLEQLAKHQTKVVCLDVDGEALKTVARLFRPRLAANLRTEKVDFLQWSSSAHRRKAFDCIVINPPFLGKKQDEAQIRIKHNGQDGLKSVPVEAAFIIRSLELLRPGGMLLSVLPASVISGKNAGWIRQLILSFGSVKYVHELPPKAFRRLEARLYLMAFERGGVRRPTLLCNHNLISPEKLRVKESALERHDRWDYGFHDSRLRLDAAMAANPLLVWRSVGDAVSMRRGGMASPEGKASGVHTCDFRNGTWLLSRAKAQGSQERQHLQRGDLLVKRVGRGCSQSVGIVLVERPVGVTDCVLILRPKARMGRYATLLGLRTILGASGSSLVEQGTGATYITEESLRDLHIPMGIGKRYPEMFRRYVRCARTRDAQGLYRVEAELREVLGL